MTAPRRAGDAGATAALDAATRALQLPTVRAQAAALAEQAVRERRGHLGYLADVLSAEVDDRAERRRTRLVNDARFPRLKRLADFDYAAAPTVEPAVIATLGAGGYLAAGQPVVLLGDSGTGKSRLLIGLGVAACESGRRVRYTTAAKLVNELAEAADDRQLSRVVARYSRVELLCLDELGYIGLDRRGAELLFQILAEREEKSAVITASNLPFSEWGNVFPDPRLAAAVVDRLTFNGYIIETGTVSYRLAHTQARRRAARASDR